MYKHVWVCEVSERFPAIFAWLRLQLNWNDGAICSGVSNSSGDAHWMHVIKCHTICLACCSLCDTSSWCVLKDYNILLFNFRGINVWLIFTDPKYSTTPILQLAAQQSKILFFSLPDCSYWSIATTILISNTYQRRIRRWGNAHCPLENS